MLRHLAPLAAIAGLVFLSVPVAGRAATAVSLDQCFNPGRAESELARPAADRSANHGPLTIAGRTYARGVGTQLETTFAVAVNGAVRFTGLVGVDDATRPGAAVIFQVRADGHLLWTSGPLQPGQPPRPVDLGLRGHRLLEFCTRDVGTAWSRAYADWVDANFTVEGKRPEPAVVPPYPERPYILTPPAPAAPRINGSRVFGVRPGHPFLFHIPATGVRPMTFAADGLPAGLSLNPASGEITGTVRRPGTYRVTLRATNARGSAEGPFRIVVGKTIALTPPMGWNSWNCWAGSVDQAKVLASARAMVSTGLIEHGWTYINIDDTWQGARPEPTHALHANAKFPDMKALCDEVHALGLKMGLYSTPWITSYAGYPGGSADNPEGRWHKPQGPRLYNRGIKPWAPGRYCFAEVDAREWASWGIDYLKYDWHPIDVHQTRLMAEALRRCGRDIVYSLSNAAPYADAAEWAHLANSWRTTGDIRDSWSRLLYIWAQQDKWRRFAGPGHWNDPDMLVVGNLGWGPHLHPTHLTPNEQYTHISLWCLWSAPLLIGCPLNQLDPFTLNLLSNDEVLAIDQDPRGAQARRAWARGREEIYVKPLADGSDAVGLFNLSDGPQTISVPWAKLGLGPPRRVRDLWRQQDSSVDLLRVTGTVPRHGVLLLRVWPARGSAAARTSSAE